MNLTKQQADAFTPDGWVYCGSWNDHYHYQIEVKNARGSPTGVFTVMSLLDEDMTPNNLALMVKLGMTRVCKLT